MRTPRRNGVPADRPRHFCDGGGAGRIASLVPRGAGGPSPGIGTVPHGRPDRPGANGAFCLSGTSRSPRARPCSLPKPSLALSPALASPALDAALSLKRFSLAEPTLLLPEPGL